MTASLALRSAWWALPRGMVKGGILAVPLAAGTAAFVAAAFLLRCPELRELRRSKQPVTTAEEKKTEKTD